MPAYQEFGSRFPELSRREVLLKTNNLTELYARRSINILHAPVKEGLGKEVLGSVEGRPEDEQLGIDSYGEHILTNLIRESLLPAYVFGEHNNYDFAGGNPRVFFAIDSFDNTSQYKRGLDTTPYSVLAAYHPDGRPMAATAADLKDRKFYIAQGIGQDRQSLVVVDTEMTQTKEIYRSERTTIKDPNFTLATYLGSNEYSLKFFSHFDRLVADMHPKGVLYGGGGAYIYALLAAGAVDAYVMFDEPRGEIDPGFPLARAAGCTIVSVDPETGKWEDYKFEPEKHHQNVPLFIAASTSEVRDEIISYYLQSIQRAA